MIQLTQLAKDGGPLTKRISLAPDGSLLSDGSACTMAVGRGRRTTCATMQEFADGISGLSSDQAIALGALRRDLPDEVQVVTKSRLEKLNGSANNLIARTSDHIFYRAGQPALALIDIDCTGMPAAVRDRIKEANGFWAALVSVIPELAQTARVERRSTSTGISNADTGEQLPGSNGSHIYLHALDGADIERFLRTLHDRCWLAGFGWFMVGAGGQLLERSIVDRMVYAPERLVFEGAPVLDPPLKQDAASRKAVAHDGGALDTIAACPPLTVVERARLQELRDQDAHRLAPDRAKARDQFITEQAAHIVKRTGCTVESARRTAEKQCNGVLLSEVALLFDDTEFASSTVADVLADPDRFVGATLADPLEGVEYGRCKAKVMRRASGEVWIHSFAHGRTVYELQYDARDAQAQLRKLAPADVPDGFVRLVLEGALNEAETEALRNLAHEISGVGKPALDATLRSARKERATRRAKAKSARQAAARRDRRPHIDAPIADDARVPVVTSIDEVLCNQHQLEPPIRDAEGRPTDARRRAPVMLHETLTAESNPGERDESDSPACADHAADDAA